MSHNNTPVLFLFVFFLATGCNNRDTKQEPVYRTIKGSATTEPAHLAVEKISTRDYCDAYTNSITQTFIARKKAVTVITARHGLKVTVNPAVLETVNGEPFTGDIKVKIVEITTPGELFKTNAATISNGQLLVSGGSYYVAMESNGQQLQLKKGETMQMEFPKIKDNEMELFYGNRNMAGDMNWQRAETPLRISQAIVDYNPPFEINYSNVAYKSKYRMFDSLTEKVIFMDRKMTLRDMVGELQERGVDKKIDSIYISWENFYGDVITYRSDKPYAHYVKKYRIMTCKEIEAERDSIAKSEKVRLAQQEANRKYDEEWRMRYNENSLVSQIQKYYAPSEVKQLGWINCDRFYKDPQSAEVPVEMPYTLNNTDVQYFLIYKSFNGLMSGQLSKNNKGQYTLSKLPQGQAVTLVAFAKSNGQLFQCREDFVIKAGEKLKPAFTAVSAEEMKKIFGANVKI